MGAVAFDLNCTLSSFYVLNETWKTKDSVPQYFTVNRIFIYV